MSSFFLYAIQRAFVFILACQDDTWQWWVRAKERGVERWGESCSRSGGGNDSSVEAQLAESVAGQISWQSVWRGCGTSQQRALGRQATAQLLSTPQFNSICIYAPSPPPPPPHILQKYAPLGRSHLKKKKKSRCWCVLLVNTFQTFFTHGLFWDAHLWGRFNPTNSWIYVQICARGD